MTRYVPRSLQFRIIRAVTEEMRRLNLELLNDDKIKLVKLPISAEKMGAGCFVSPTVEAFNSGVLNTADDFGYGVQVTLIRKSNQAFEGDTNAGMEEMDRFLEWREKVEEYFLPTVDEPLRGVDEVHTLTLEPGFLYDPTSFLAQYDAQALILRCWVQKTRQQ